MANNYVNKNWPSECSQEPCKVKPTCLRIVYTKQNVTLLNSSCINGVQLILVIYGTHNANRGYSLKCKELSGVSRWRIKSQVFKVSRTNPVMVFYGLEVGIATLLYRHQIFIFFFLAKIYNDSFVFCSTKATRIQRKMIKFIQPTPTPTHRLCRIGTEPVPTLCEQFSISKFATHWFSPPMRCSKILRQITNVLYETTRLGCYRKLSDDFVVLFYRWKLV